MADASSQPPASSQKHGRLVARRGIGCRDRWLIPVVIDRTRRGTHDRADETGPCRGCATAVSCRAARRTNRRARPSPSPAVHTAHRWRKLDEPRDVRLASATAVAHGRPDALGSADMQDTAGALLQAAGGGHSGAVNLDQIAAIAIVARARASGVGFFRRMPAAASGTRPSRMHRIRNAQLAGSPAVASRPAEAARCLEVACEHPNARLPSAVCRMWRELSAHTAGPYQYATNACLRSDGRDLLAPCASLPPCRGTSRGRMRGVGATCTAPTTHGRL